jgi:hypothetical protein
MNHSGSSARNHRSRILLAALVKWKTGKPMATNSISTRTHTNAHTPHGKNHSVVTTRTIHTIFIHFFTKSPTLPRQARRTARTVRSGSCFHNFGLLLIQYKSTNVYSTLHRTIQFSRYVSIYRFIMDTNNFNRKYYSTL